ncbi:hypothetical protein HMPREF9388_0624 [Streptococcus sanguinis SK353]|uniref:Uncharacterized protein n=1 Tax=Streptococcus sanguinis SK353 TaxID=888815 RepID=F0FD42_STRSA|nr:hypothetical protein HMPREF9388_0624 [Streptococcus sanguinis SK353]
MALAAVFWNHSKQHSSKTSRESAALSDQFWNHSKQHSSKTLYKLNKPSQ